MIGWAASERNRWDPAEVPGDALALSPAVRAAPIDSLIGSPN
jgi:hypothetical protein